MSSSRSRVIPCSHSLISVYVTWCDSLLPAHVHSHNVTSNRPPCNMSTTNLLSIFDGSMHSIVWTTCNTQLGLCLTVYRLVSMSVQSVHYVLYNYNTVIMSDLISFLKIFLLKIHFSSFHVFDLLKILHYFFPENISLRALRLYFRFTGSHLSKVTNMMLLLLSATYWIHWKFVNGNIY